MYELIILALLMHWPLHGYFITKISNEIIGPWEKVSRGTVYPLLRKMEQGGLIRQTQLNDERYNTSDRQSKGYEITQAGRQRFLELMLDTTSGLHNYRRLFHIKAMHLNFLPLDEQLYLIGHYQSYCQTAMHHQTQEARELLEDPEQRRAEMGGSFFDSVLDYMHYTADSWKVELEWCAKLRERVTGSSGTTNTQSTSH
ncbi:PadR family transcriptional regulator [Ktedonospora formicarum]|uniref:Transcription regulator PadR N-terminal domain-containing protein n=1 Tax=Ktedonospora formicarum TaxID=2778364 RepID=A0A8J3MVP7_9CHLR|nr:PadR family transcriptional regulator [Ktedonospora formicarum]GHO47878.1 hypothetical protein KSX_60410 [Ktedonospora formicarum]